MKPFILFAHGAGAGSQHPWMHAWSERLAAIGRVSTFDYPYMQAGRRGPDRLPKLVAAHGEALERAVPDGASAVLAGKSMGSRVGCHLTLDPALTRTVRALVCFGYPLVGASRNRPVRDEVLLALQTPILFIQGTRDKLCPLELLESVRSRMQAPNSLHVVEAGDHSLAVTKTRLKQQGESQADVDERIGSAIAAFVAEHV